ncbi:hypothetical protein IQ264_31070 [Phormidium sp. LEGE 05292]|uniref:hypothetical protein n=1 Tax=[Phormidium] sp. LEGE 05292 TaxID=767427 RepID=UPI0018823A9A|nr:hypothetical protein [Phormidium sp. LEGE 05292]MBE9229847.1 hypothetical protein [Phormidium sp. LEGE 05292]
MLGLDQFFQELESHCPEKAIATFLDSEGECFVVDLTREVDKVKYGYDRHTKALFSKKITQGCHPYGSLILRSFTAEIDRLTHLPYKELRGYILKAFNDRLEFEKLSPEMLFACQNTDAETGEPLPLEQSVRYC